MKHLNSVKGFGHLAEAIRKRGSLWTVYHQAQRHSVSNLPMKILCKMGTLGWQEGCDLQSSRGSVV